MADQTQGGRPFRILAAHVAWSIPAMEVIKVAVVMKRQGAPEHIRSDNELEPARSTGRH